VEDVHWYDIGQTNQKLAVSVGTLVGGCEAGEVVDFERENMEPAAVVDYMLLLDCRHWLDCRLARSTV